MEFEGSTGAWRIFSASGGSSPVIWMTEPAASRTRVEIHGCISQDTPTRDGSTVGRFAEYMQKVAHVYRTFPVSHEPFFDVFCCRLIRRVTGDLAPGGN